MAKKSPAEKLADLIEANKDCQFDIDNDVWYMVDPKNGEAREITDSEKDPYNTDWYAHSSNYGAGIAEALIVLLNRRGFDIKAYAV